MELVKLLTDDDGYKIDKSKWHYVVTFTDDPTTLCSDEFFGIGQSSCTYKEKTVERGGITCERCLKIIKEIKDIKL